MASAVYQPTASQFASAIMHLDRRADWRTVRIDGTRYVSLLSGRSNHVYLVRASGDGCSCPWYANTLGQCSHMLAIQLDALEDELAEDWMATAPARYLKRYEDLVPAECDDRSCTDDALPRESGDEGRYCKRHLLAEVF